MRISIIGTGYVGLVTGVCLASKGHQVICIDIKQDIVDKINKMVPPIYEEGLEDLLKTVVSSHKLYATTDLEKAVRETEISIIAVGTPTIGEDKIDLSYIEKAAEQIGTVLKDKKEYHVVCVKSTVIPGTTDTLVRGVVEKASGKKAGEFGLAMNPEFLREGKAVGDFMNPDRIVLGSYDDKSYQVMEKVYANHFDAPIVHVNLRTAEMIKYTANALLATLISFSNEIGMICEKAGNFDVNEVMKYVSLDKRFNPRLNGQLVNPEAIHYLKAGCGFGGSCFPKDVKALIAYSKGLGMDPKMIEATININKEQPVRLVDRLEGSVGTLKDKKIAVLGLAFKPGTDDVRESPSITIINSLLDKGAHVFAVDPIAVSNMEKVIPGKGKPLSYSVDYKEALKGADGAVLVTSWPEYVSIPPEGFVELMSTPILMDGRRVLDKTKFERAGVKYMGVGLS